MIVSPKRDSSGMVNSADGEQGLLLQRASSSRRCPIYEPLVEQIRKEEWPWPIEKSVCPAPYPQRKTACPARNPQRERHCLSSTKLWLWRNQDEISKKPWSRSTVPLVRYHFEVYTPDVPKDLKYTCPQGTGRQAKERADLVNFPHVNGHRSLKIDRRLK